MDVIELINSLLWNQVLVWFLLFTGALFTLLLKGVQIRYFIHAVAVVFRKPAHAPLRTLSSFQAFCTGLGARTGTGNIIGVAMAIYSGGPGAVFWMWVVAVLGMATSFAESSLAQFFKQRGTDGSFYGGPAFYIQIGLKRKYISKIFSILLIPSIGLTFNAVQANSLASVCPSSLGIPKLWSGAFISVATGYIIFGGIKRVGRASELIVPFMALGYIAMALVMIVLNYERIGEVLSMILATAFNTPAAQGGMMGYGFASALNFGVRRGLFSNEAGIGSSPNIAATAQVDHPCEQGFVQMFGVFVDTALVCTSTAVTVLFSGQLAPGSGTTGALLVQQALHTGFGDLGASLLSSSIFLFAFTTIAANYSLGEVNLYFLTKNKAWLLGFRTLVMLTVFVGSMGESSAVWELADLMMGMVALINLASILLLANLVRRLLKSYLKRAASTQNLSRFTVTDLGIEKYENDPLLKVWT